MNASETRIAPSAWSIPGWLPAVMLLVLMAVAGPSLGSLSRPLFIFACFAAGWFAWSKSPGQHLQAVLVLFAFAPFLRRLVDYQAGFDGSGVMLLGPMLALLAPAYELRQLLLPGRRGALGVAPLVIIGFCIAYGVCLTVLESDWSAAASGAIKWGAPLIYAAALQQRVTSGYRLINDMTSAFVYILPLTGLYAIYQYVDPPMWDRYWLTMASITSAGRPEPYEVRSFSTMNGPASFATFTAVGMLLVYFLRSSWQTRLVVAPACLALLLSLYRTAWISLVVGVLFCLCFSAVRRRAAMTALILAITAVLVIAFTPFGDLISDRIATLGSGGDDGSAQERLQEFVTLWTLPDSGLIGEGFGLVDTGTPGEKPVDGMIISCWQSFGIVGGLICLSALLYVIFRAIAPALKYASRESVVLGGLACGWFVQMPLGSIASGEIGFLFWTTCVLAAFERPAGVEA